MRSTDSLLGGILRAGVTLIRVVLLHGVFDSIGHFGAAIKHVGQFTGREARIPEPVSRFNILAALHQNVVNLASLQHTCLYGDSDSDTALFVLLLH